MCRAMCSYFQYRALCSPAPSPASTNMPLLAPFILTMGLVCAAAQREATMSPMTMSTATWSTPTGFNDTTDTNNTTDTTYTTETTDNSSTYSVDTDGPRTNISITSLPSSPAPTSTSPSTPKRDITVAIKRGLFPTRATVASAGVDKTGIIIISVIVVAGLIVVLVCFVRRKNSRRYSMDLRSDGASVPLSVVVDQNEPDPNTPPHNAMQSGDRSQMDSQESQDSEALNPGDPKPKEESGPTEAPQKSDQAEEAGAAGGMQEPASTGAADVASADVASEAATTEGTTDDEGIVSNKTSVESLKEPGEKAAGDPPTDAAATDALIESK